MSATLNPLAEQIVRRLEAAAKLEIASKYAARMLGANAHTSAYCRCDGICEAYHELVEALAAYHEASK